MGQNCPEMDVETRLKRAIKRGDPTRLREAFRNLYEQNVRLVYRVLIDSFGKDDDTDDDVQESFLALLNNPMRLLVVDHIVDYWIQSAKYICGHRKEKRQRIEELEEETRSQGQSIPELIQGKELFARIESLLGHPNSDIVVLRAAYGYSEKEIAERLRMGEDAVSYRYRKSIKELRRKLKDEEE